MKGLNDTERSARAGLRKETLSRLQRRSSCDFATLEALAHAVGFWLTATDASGAPLSPDDHFPLRVDREFEACIAEPLKGLPKRLLPIRMYVAGGAALHFYTGERTSKDIDASFSRRILLPEDLEVSCRDADADAEVSMCALCSSGRALGQGE